MSGVLKKLKGAEDMPVRSPGKVNSGYLWLCRRNVPGATAVAKEERGCGKVKERSSHRFCLGVYARIRSVRVPSYPGFYIDITPSFPPRRSTQPS